MGYTHYFTRPAPVSLEQYAAITEDFKKVVPVIKAKGVVLVGGWGEPGTEPEVTDEEVNFNGLGDDSHETFEFRRDASGFECCKTARKPYDLAVTGFLLIAKHHCGDGIEVRSDGEGAEWSDAKALCQGVLGYGEEYGFDADGDLRVTPPDPELFTPAEWCALGFNAYLLAAEITAFGSGEFEAMLDSFLQQIGAAR